MGYQPMSRVLTALADTPAKKARSEALFSEQKSASLRAESIEVQLASALQIVLTFSHRMLPLDDPRWGQLNGGYRVPYDPRPALARLRDGDDSVWDELWQELHHQGDVGEASYAAVPHLVTIHRERDIPSWQTYSIIGTIEQCRAGRPNPPLPYWLKDSYWNAWGDVVSLGCRDLARTDDETTVQAILGAIALAKGLRPVGDALLNFSADEIAAMILSNYRG